MNYRSTFLGNIPTVTKNLLIINVLFYLASLIIPGTFGFRVEDYLGLHLVNAHAFNPIQLISYMFLHAYWSPSGGIEFTHLFFNMFAVFMFGRVLESVWGGKRFLFYYLATGVGAALIHMIVQYYGSIEFVKAVDYYMNNASNENLQLFLEKYLIAVSPEVKANYGAFAKAYNEMVNVDQARAIGLSKEFLHQYQIDYLNGFITVGASGAVFGILIAFGMLFPDTELMLLFPPIPIKAKYFVIIYGAVELIMGVGGFHWDNVAHWAHLGGMIWGFIIIQYWKRKGKLY